MAYVATTASRASLFTFLAGVGIGFDLAEVIMAGNAAGTGSIMGVTRLG